MWKKIKLLWNKVNPFDVHHIVRNIVEESDRIQEKIKFMVHEISEIRILVDHYSMMLEKTEEDAKRNHAMLDAVSACSPDMIWAKDLCGKYTYANRKIISGLLFSGTLSNTIGRTDIEMALARKLQVGNENHTFGELCGDSDNVTIHHGVPMEFLEYGQVNGQLLILEVHKSVIRDEKNEIIGTVGVGRDVTKDYLQLQFICDTTTDENTKKLLEEFINYKKFTGGVAHGCI